MEWNKSSTRSSGKTPARARVPFYKECGVVVMRLATLFAVAFLLVCTAPARAQWPPVRQGDRVRVSHDCGRKNELRSCRWTTGIVMRMSADTLVLITGDELTTHQLATVVRLEVSRGTRSHEIKG